MGECISAQPPNESGGRAELPPVLDGGEYSPPFNSNGSPPVASLNGPHEVPGQALASNVDDFEAIQYNQQAELQAIQYPEHETNAQVVGIPEADHFRWLSAVANPELPVVEHSTAVRVEQSTLIGDAYSSPTVPDTPGVGHPIPIAWEP